MQPKPVKMNKFVTDYTLLDYIGHLPDEGCIKLDCSLGVNQSPLANKVFAKLHEFRQESGGDPGNYRPIKDYPGDYSVKDTLVEWYKSKGVGAGWLTKEHFVLGNGSLNILCNLNLLTLTCQKKAMGHAPQFTPYIDNVYCTGAAYDAYYMQRANNYKFDTAAYLEQMSSDYDVFIVENPNNPTGQVIPLSGIRKIAEKALSLSTILIVDEAFAEFMPFDTTAINLVPEFSNVIVTRSFSKGFGMAGMRLGYCVSQSLIITQLLKIKQPVTCNGIARLLAKTALEAAMNGDSPDGLLYDPFGIDAVIDSKYQVLSAINDLNKAHGRNVKIAETFKSTPIMTLYYDGAGTGFNFQKHLAFYGLSTVSCEYYLGLDRRAVRLMLPRPSNMPLLLQILTEAIQNLPVSQAVE